MRLLVGCAVFAAVGLIVCSAGAQQKAPEQRGGVTFSFDKSRNAAADNGRARAVAGDCKAALDLFDEALRHSVDPTLYRDRGVCHEKLGDVYPAIDDYRAYLAQSPNAPDYEKFHQRLDDLIKSSSQDLAPNLGRGGDFDSEMRGGVTDGSTPVHTSTSGKIKEDDDKNKEKENDAARAKDDTRPLSTIEYEEDRDKQSNKGALRKGTGFIIGAYLYPRYVANPWAFGFGQGIGIRAGYALNSWSSLSLELGYMAQLSTGDASRADGFTTMFAWEMRFPFDRWADNQFVFSIGGGYENLTNNFLGQAYASFVARGRAGWRHVFGPGFALDILADGGFMGTAPINAPSGTQSFGVGAFVGGIVSVTVGF